MGDDSRISALLASIDQAENALASLDASQREQFPDGWARLQAMLTYARLTVGQTDPLLIPDNVLNNFSAALGNIAGNPQAVATDPDGHANALLDWVIRLPAPHDRDMEQAVRDAATNFRRAAGQHTRQLDAEATSIRDSLTETKDTLDQARAESEERVRVRQEALDAQLVTLQAEASAAKAQVDALVENLEDRFEQEQKARAKKADEAWSAKEKELTASADKALERVKEIRIQVEGVAGAVGAASTANHFEDEAKRERMASWITFGVTVAIFGGAVAIAGNAASVDNQDTKHLIAKLAVSFVLGGLAAFTGARANDHRRREKRARDRELDLRSFGPFIATLEKNEQDQVRRSMANRTFGRWASDDNGSHAEEAATPSE